MSRSFMRRSTRASPISAGGSRSGTLNPACEGSAIQNEGVICFAKETRILPMRHVAASWSHRLGQNDVRRQLVPRPAQEGHRATRVRRVDSAGETTGRSAIILMSGVVNRRGG